MKVEEFYDAFKRLGERYLVHAGWVYKYKMWHFIDDTIRLSFIPVTTKFGRSFQVKHLTLTLRHTQVEASEDLEEKKKYNNNDKFCPAQISPGRLRPFVESGFSRRVWHYVHPREDDRSHELAYMPIYYGGEHRWILDQNDAPEEENRETLLEFLKVEGIDYLEEEIALTHLETAFEDVSLFARKWVEFMTPQETMKQFILYGGWWVDKEWLEAYEKKFGKVDVKVTLFDRLFKKLELLLGR